MTPHTLPRSQGFATAAPVPGTMPPSPTHAPARKRLARPAARSLVALLTTALFSTTPPLTISALAAGIPTLDEILVTDQTEGLAGTASSSSEGTVTAPQMESRPLLRPGEILEVVPVVWVVSSFAHDHVVAPCRGLLPRIVAAAGMHRG